MVSRLALALACLAACGPTQRRRHVDPDFVCKDRRMEYVAAGSLVYAEQGIRLTCTGDVPRVEQYFIAKDGKETKHQGIISSTVWEETWTQFQAAGWRNLEDCVNPSAGDRDPIYTFEATDGETTKGFRCQGNELPFPFDRLRNTLDRAAGELPAQPQ